MLADAACPDEAAWTALNEFADGELAAADAPALFAHLADCPACRADFETLLDTRRAFRADVLALPPSADAALFARLERMRRRETRAPFRRREGLARALGHRVRVGTLVGAALVVTAAAAAGALLVERPPPPPALIQAVDAHGALFLLDRALTVEAEREGGG